jgi:hypothetical protein
MTETISTSTHIGVTRLAGNIGARLTGVDAGDQPSDDQVARIPFPQTVTTSSVTMTWLPGTSSATATAGCSSTGTAPDQGRACGTWPGPPPASCHSTRQATRPGTPRGGALDLLGEHIDTWARALL